MFKNKSVERKFEFIFNQWFGQGNYFDSPLRGVQNPSDYPFKKYFLESDAGVLSEIPKNTVVNNVKIALQIGNIYDLSRLQKQKKRALIVTKIANDRFKILNGNTVSILAREDLARFKVPLFINTSVMKALDLENPGPNTLTSKFFFGADGQPDQSKSYQMKFYLALRKTRTFENDEKQAAEELINYSQINSAEILSYAQLKQKGVYNNRDSFVFGNSYSKDRVIVDFFDLSNKFNYSPVGSIADVEWVADGAGGINFKDFSENFKDQFEKDSETEQNLIFRPINWTGQDSDSLIDDLFIRI